MRFLINGNREELPLRKIYWKPGAAFRSIFARAGEFAVVSVGNDPVEFDFHWVANQVFAFEYKGNKDFSDSISRLILELNGNTLSTNWSFHQLKTLVGKIAAGNPGIVAAKSGEDKNHTDSKIIDIEFLS